MFVFRALPALARDVHCFFYAAADCGCCGPDKSLVFRWGALCVEHVGGGGNRVGVGVAAVSSGEAPKPNLEFLGSC